MAAIKAATGTDRFTNVLAVARVIGDKAVWENHKPFREAIVGNPLKIITFRDMVTEIDEELGTTLAATEVGRLLQMFRAAGLDIAKQ